MIRAAPCHHRFPRWVYECTEPPNEAYCEKCGKPYREYLGEVFDRSPLAKYPPIPPDPTMR